MKNKQIIEETSSNNTIKTTKQIIELKIGNVLDNLKEIPDESIDCIVTSPPYYNLREYVAPNVVWGGDPNCNHDFINNKLSIFCSKCGAWRGQLGLELDYRDYISHLLMVTAELKRVLKPTGTLWWNMGTSYNNKRDMQLPARFAIRMADEQDWILRNTMIWKKVNPLPSGVKDRLTNSYEFIFFFTKKKHYFFNLDAIRVPNKVMGVIDMRHPGIRRQKLHPNSIYNKSDDPHLVQLKKPHSGYFNYDGQPRFNLLGKNPGDILELTTQPFKGAHFACVDEQTECLTQQGWKKYNDLNLGENIITFNVDTDQLEVKPLLAKYVYECNEEITKVDSRDLSMWITNNHRCIVLKRTKKGERKEIIYAQFLNSRTKILTGSKGLLNQTEIYPNSFIEVLAWILTEGHYFKDSNRIAIYQNKGEKADRIRNALIKSNLTFSERARHGVYRGYDRSKQLCFIIKAKDTKQIKEIAPNKEIPISFLFKLSRKQLELFLEITIQGDGNKRQDGRKSIVQKNQKSVDLYQICAILLGYRANIGTPRKEIQRKDIQRIFLTNHYWTGLRKTNGKGTSIKREKYIGKVWCPNTENGTFVARRNGKIFITGNTFPPKLPEFCIKAGSPENGVILDPFAGSGTTLMVARQLGRSAIGIEISPEYANLIKQRLNWGFDLNIEWKIDEI